MKLSIATACALLMCAGCAVVQHTPHAREGQVVVECSEPLIDASHPRLRPKSGRVLTVTSTKRAFENAGLRLRPMSLRFSWRGVSPHPEAAFWPAVPIKGPSKRFEDVIAAVYPNVSDAFTVAQDYGPHVHGSCDMHLRVGNVLLTWSGREDARLRSAIGQLRSIERV